MKLNDIAPALGSKKAKKRLGRGCGSGLGKTCARGHKGQHSRSGGYHKVGFEGGQMPLQRRLPKYGFASHIARMTAEVPLEALNNLEGQEITLSTLKLGNLISNRFKRAKIYLSGEIRKSIHIKGLAITEGARAAVQAAGGTVEE